jgi:hypothetical protein
LQWQSRKLFGLSNWGWVERCGGRVVLISLAIWAWFRTWYRFLVKMVQPLKTPGTN